MMSKEGGDLAMKTRSGSQQSLFVKRVKNIRNTAGVTCENTRDTTILSPEQMMNNTSNDLGYGLRKKGKFN